MTSAFRDYDKEYYHQIAHPWSEGGKFALDQIKDVFSVKGDVLDLGFGTGRHSVEFALNGCHVDSYDVSIIGRDRLKKAALSMALPIKVYTQDFFEFEAKKQYDIVFAYMTLQYAKNEVSFDSLICKLKRCTKPGGINYIRLPIKGISLEFPFLLKNVSELNLRYMDWEVILESQQSMSMLNGKIRNHILMIAKKPFRSRG